MRYSDLKVQTANLPVGRHLIYERGPDAVFVEVVKQAQLPDRTVYRLVVRWSDFDRVPRHSDLFTDLLLKAEARPDLRLSLLEACEQICSGVAPSQLFEQCRFPRYFREPGDAQLAYPMTMYQTAGMPTELFLCALQGLIVVYDDNDPKANAPDMFRHAFSRLGAGDPVLEVLAKLAPQTPAGKRYYDLSKRA
jgi:hypothetical protein